VQDLIVAYVMDAIIICSIVWAAHRPYRRRGLLVLDKSVIRARNAAIGPS
jgi:hypothetical protein